MQIQLAGIYYALPFEMVAKNLNMNADSSDGIHSN